MKIFQTNTNKTDSNWQHFNIHLQKEASKIEPTKDPINDYLTII